MEERELKKLLQVTRRPTAKRGWRCPDETALAAYVAGSMDDSSRTRTEAHVVDCDFCLNQVAFLTQSADWSDSPEVPASLVNVAADSVSRKSAKDFRWNWTWATAGALASLALVFVLIALQLRKQESASLPGEMIAQQSSPVPGASPVSSSATPSRPDSSPSLSPPKMNSSPVRTVRSNTGAALLPLIITPRDGAVLQRKELEFRWQPVSDAIFYEVQIMAADGDLLFETKTEETRFTPGSAVSLVPGAKYFVVARAHLRQGKASPSSIVSFSLAE